jgi:regulatory protein RepA
VTMMKEVTDWFERERGIRAETLEAFGLWTNDYGDVIIPYSNGDKIRPNPTKPLGDRPRFSFTKGKTPDLFVAPAFEIHADVAFLVEGETDAMRLWQELKDEEGAIYRNAAIFSIGGINTWRPEFGERFEEYAKVYVVLDNDDDYKTAAVVDHVWLHQIRQDIGPKAKRVRLPDGVKDLCEFHDTFALDVLRTLMERNTSVSRFRPLDLTIEPPPVNWLLEDLVARGDVTLESGVSNLGKSWFTMGLAVGCTEGWESFLGKKMPGEPGRVLYIDEENPEDVVYDRLLRLGLKTMGNLRYLWNNGIRLDRSADDLLAEAIEFDPVLIVLDSMTRLHGKEENSVGDMAPLLNDCIKPLARQTGAAVVVIHHHDKAASGPRGSSDILNSVDGALDVYETGKPAEFRMRLSKSRRRVTNTDTYVQIIDKPDGTVVMDSKFNSMHVPL